MVVFQQNFFLGRVQEGRSEKKNVLRVFSCFITFVCTFAGIVPLVEIMIACSYFPEVERKCVHITILDHILFVYVPSPKYVQSVERNEKLKKWFSWMLFLFRKVFVVLLACVCTPEETRNCPKSSGLPYKKRCNKKDKVSDSSPLWFIQGDLAGIVILILFEQFKRVIFFCTHMHIQLLVPGENSSLKISLRGLSHAIQLIDFWRNMSLSRIYFYRPWFDHSRRLRFLKYMNLLKLFLASSFLLHEKYVGSFFSALLHNNFFSSPFHKK